MCDTRVPTLQEVGLINSLATDLVDVWRDLHPEATDTFTVWNERTNARASNRGLRIDYAMCSPSLKSQIIDCQVKLDLPQVMHIMGLPICAIILQNTASVLQLLLRMIVNHKKNLHECNYSVRSCDSMTRDADLVWLLMGTPCTCVQQPHHEL